MRVSKILGMIVIGVVLLRNLSSLLSTTIAFVQASHGVSNGHPSAYWLGSLMGSVVFEIILLILFLRLVKR